MSGRRCFTGRESDPETMRKCELSGRFNLPMVMSTAGRGGRGPTRDCMRVVGVLHAP